MIWVIIRSLLYIKPQSIHQFLRQNMRLKQKTAIITGGATGIGLACARQFVAEGARVVLFGRRQDRLDEALETLGGASMAVAGDITQENDVQEVVDQTVKAFGRIDILINNAGTFSMAPLHETDGSDWDQVINTNLRGVFQLTRRVLGHMAKQKSGSLIHISSILGLVATPMAAAYNASKGGLNQFSRTVAVEYGPMGIRSNAVCPGMVETEMTQELRGNTDLMNEWLKSYPIGRFAQPEDIAKVCLFLASDDSAYVTGTVLPVDGGYTAL